MGLWQFLPPIDLGSKSCEPTQNQHVCMGHQNTLSQMAAEQRSKSLPEPLKKISVM